MGCGFRFNDIKRWKKGEYLSLQPVGVKINNIEDYNNEALAKIYIMEVNNLAIKIV